MRSSGACGRWRRASGRLRRAGARLALAALAAIAGLAGGPAVHAHEPASAKGEHAGVFESVEEALARAFPEADRIERRNLLLDAEQARAVEQRAHAELESRIVPVHVARRGDALLGYAVLDVHNVRTMPEALLVVLTPEGRVRSLRILAFHEPPEYRPPERWLAGFEGRRPGDTLRLGREVHGIAGATLSSHAVTRAVRRALALYAVALAPQQDPGAAPGAAEDGADRGRDAAPEEGP